MQTTSRAMGRLAVTLAMGVTPALNLAGVPNTGNIPITDLPPDLYQGYEGGLYPNAQNVMPSEHLVAGLAMAEQIVPRNKDGAPDPDGFVVMAGIGVSNSSQSWGRLVRKLEIDPNVNGRLVLIDIATGGGTPVQLSDPEDWWYWIDFVPNHLQSQGLSAEQVQVLWFECANPRPTEGFPAHIDILETDVVGALQQLKLKFPNAAIGYLNALYYQGWATSDNPVLDEPEAYEAGFALKAVIQRQIEGDPALTFDPLKGTVTVPWLAWGPYLWADGTIPRSDGLTWLEEEFESDGTHPNSAGEEKLADLMISHFNLEPTTAAWMSRKPGILKLYVDALHDTYVTSSDPTANLGDAVDLLLEPDPTENIVLLKFDLGSLAATVHRAVLSLRANTSTATQEVFVHTSDDVAWEELTVTYETAPVLNDAEYRTGRTPRDSTMGVDVTTAVNDHLGGLFTLALKTDVDEWQLEGGFLSHEGGEPPRLVLWIENPTGDHDWSGKVDLLDFGAFQRCCAGEGLPWADSACEVFDFDYDNDVDLNDYAQFVAMP